MENRQFFESFCGSDFMVNIRTPNVQKTETTVVLVHGFWSIPLGRKYSRLSDICELLGAPCAAYELIGHGSDISHLDHANIDILIKQLEYLLEKCFNQNAILVGSCGGGLVALGAANKHQNWIKGLITLGTSLDFNVLSPEQLETIQKKGYTYVRFGQHNRDCKITKNFCASYHKIKQWEPMKVSFPVHIMQGKDDDVISWTASLKLFDFLEGNNVVLKILQKTGHRLSDIKSFEEIKLSLLSFLES